MPIIRLARVTTIYPCDCHDAVCARDFTHDPGDGFDSYKFADWLRSRCDNGTENRVKYIISNHRIASPTEDWTWRDYDGPNPHTQHVHVSVEHPSSLFDDERSWGWGAEEEDVPLTQDEINKIAAAVWQYAITDVDEAKRPAATVVKYVRSDTTHIRYVNPQDVWAFELADDINQEVYQAQRLLRYTRNDAHASRDILESQTEQE